jgi:hypothetical protein
MPARSTATRRRAVVPGEHGAPQRQNKFWEFHDASMPTPRRQRVDDILGWRRQAAGWTLKAFGEVACRRARRAAMVQTQIEEGGHFTAW